ncbi:MAG: hypothetical protein IKU69_01365 [Roseburia sp.]|nr:hypothetical protein [Roseburia sp.]
MRSYEYWQVRELRRSGTAGFHKTRVVANSGGYESFEEAERLVFIKQVVTNSGR